MSQSIFHIRSLDTGNGWAIDEYDECGVWRSPYRNNVKGESLNKQEAQQRMFYLRQKEINKMSNQSPIKPSDDVVKKLYPGLHQAGYPPPYIQGEMVLRDPKSGLLWRVDCCSSSSRDPSGVIAHLVEPSRSLTMPCNVLRTWLLGEDWIDTDRN